MTLNIAIPPGETLAESLEASGMSQQELSQRTGLSRKTVNGIVNGREPITATTALRLEQVFRVPARFWIALQANYDEARARIEERNRLARDVDWPERIGVPVRELVRRGVIPPRRDKVDRLRDVLQFFGVASPAEFDTVWSPILAAQGSHRPDGRSERRGSAASRIRLRQLP